MDLSPLPWQRSLLASLHALRGRRAQAVLLHGPAGIGKLHLSLAFAASALCESTDSRPAEQFEACGSCAACALLSAGSHPDLRVVTPDALAYLRPSDHRDDAESDEAPVAVADMAVDASDTSGRGPKASREIRIEQVLEVTRQTAVTTHRGGVRIVILVPADALNGISANALLKTLEEPPGDTVFVLVSASPHDLLPTIRSRCLQIAVPVPARAASLQWLMTQGLQSSEAASRLDAAGGAPLHALTPPIDQLDEASLRELLNLLRRGAESDPAAVVAAVGRQVLLPAAIALFQRWSVDLLTVRHAGRVLYHPSEQASLRALASQLTDAALFGWIDGLRELRRHAEHPLNARLVIEQALFRYRRAFLPAGRQAEGPSL